MRGLNSTCDIHVCVRSILQAWMRFEQVLVYLRRLPDQITIIMPTRAHTRCLIRVSICDNQEGEVTWWWACRMSALSAKKESEELPGIVIQYGENESRAHYVSNETHGLVSYWSWYFISVTPRQNVVAIWKHRYSLFTVLYHRTQNSYKALAELF